MNPLRVLPVLLLGPVLACGGGSEPGEPAPDEPVAPLSVSIPDPEPAVAILDIVEDLSEEVANRMVDFADKLRRRDFAAAREWLTEEFAGHRLSGLAVLREQSLHLGAERTELDPASAAAVGPGAFLQSIADWIGPWERVELAQWKVKGAEFHEGSPLWGVVRFKITFLGDAEGGAPHSLVAWARGRVDRVRGRWMLAALELESLTHARRHAPLFTEVSAAAGVAHTGIRFGKPGNQSFAWSGAAAGDADGDGLWDLFVPSRPASFLYLAREDGTFAEAAAERGLAAPGGGTGAVFLDFDNDGDQDLALADVGWVDPDGRPGGNPLRLYVNAGGGRFDERGAELGFGARCNGYGLTALDHDLDGFLDLYVCNYGRVEAEPNDSWVQATNGPPNALYRNLGGERFEDVAAAAGAAGADWSYASAAADYDGDGDLDLYVANDYGVNALYRNEGGGRFTDAADELGVRDLGNGMGVAWGDLDADGVLDLYVANMSSTAGNRILRRLEGDGERVALLAKMAAGNTVFLQRPEAGRFEALPAEAGGIGASWAWSPVLGDLDLDGRLDVFCANGYVTGDTPWDT